MAALCYIALSVPVRCSHLIKVTDLALHTNTQKTHTERTNIERSAYNVAVITEIYFS